MNIETAWSHLASPVQEIGKALDGHVRHGEEVVESDSEVLVKFLLVLGLQSLLRGWQEGPERVVHQVQGQVRAGLAVAGLVEGEERGDAPVEDPAPALLVDILL